MTVRKPAPPVMRIGEPATGRPSAARRVPVMIPVVSWANRSPCTNATAASRRPSRTARRLAVTAAVQ